MRFIVVISQKLHRVRGHHGQFEPGRKLHRCGHMARVVGLFGTLQFNVETLRENTRQVQRTRLRTRIITLHQSLPDGTTLCA